MKIWCETCGENLDDRSSSEFFCSERCECDWRSKLADPLPLTVNTKVQIPTMTPSPEAYALYMNARFGR